MKLWRELIAYITSIQHGPHRKQKIKKETVIQTARISHKLRNKNYGGCIYRNLQGDIISLKSKGDAQKDEQTQTDMLTERDRQQGDLISLLLFFQIRKVG
jgi:hypothetical protein